MFLIQIKYNDLRGYTLTEISVTVMLLGILATLAIPRFSTSSEKSRSAEAIEILSAIWQSQQLYILDNNGAVSASLNNLDIDIPAPRYFNAPVLYTLNNHTAYIDRNNGDYRLYIENDNDITCDDTPGLAGVCTRLGIAAYLF